IATRDRPPDPCDCVSDQAAAGPGWLCEPTYGASELSFGPLVYKCLTGKYRSCNRLHDVPPRGHPEARCALLRRQHRRSMGSAPPTGRGGTRPMKRIGITSLASAAAMVALVATSFADTPSPNGASIEQRTFNDGPISTLTVTNNY